MPAAFDQAIDSLSYKQGNDLYESDWYRSQREIWQIIAGSKQYAFEVCQLKGIGKVLTRRIISEILNACAMKEDNNTWQDSGLAAKSCE